MASDFDSYRKRARRMKELEALLEMCVEMFSTPNALNPILARPLMIKIAAKVREIQALPGPHFTDKP